MLFDLQINCQKIGTQQKFKDYIEKTLLCFYINHCRLFNAKSSLYIYIKYIWFGLVGFDGISTIAGYLMPNSLYTYILNIYGLVWFYGISTSVGYLILNPLYTYIYWIYFIWFGCILWHINHCRLFNAKFLFIHIYQIYIYIYIYIICKHILLITFLNEPEILHTVKCFQVLLYYSHNLTCHLFAHIVYSIWPIDRSLSGPTTPSQSGPGSNGNKEVLHIPQISNSGSLPLDGLKSYPGHMLAVYSTVPAN